MPVGRLTIEQFAQKIKAKYPQYRDVSDSVLTERVIQKYPQYRDRVVVDNPKSPQTNIQGLGFTPMSNWLDVGAKGYSPIMPSAVVDNSHFKNSNEAAERINKALTEIDPHIHNLLRDTKKELQGRIRSQELGINPTEARSLNQQAALIESQLHEEPSVDPGEVEQYKAEMARDVNMVRNALKRQVNDLIKTNPERANQIKADVYRLDRQNNEDKEAKISKNVEKLKDGTYDYDILKGTLVKPQGFFGSLVTGFRQKNQLFKDYEFYKNTDNDAAIIKELNSKIKDVDPDEAIPVPDGWLAEQGAMLGGQPVKPVVGGIVAGALTTPLGGAAGAGAITSHEMYKLGYASALPQNYAAIKREHPDMPDFDVYTKAKELSEKQATADAVSGGAMGVLGARIGLKPTGVTAAFQKSLASGLKQLGKAGVEKGVEGLIGGAAGATGQVVKNLMAQKAGLPVATDEGIADQLVAGVGMTMGMALLMKFPKILKPSTYNKLVNEVSKMPDEAIGQEVAALQEAGVATPEEVQGVQEAIKSQRELNNSIRGDMPEPDRIKIQDKIRKRNKLEAEMEVADKAFHPELKEKIKALNEEIVSISKGGERGELQKIVAKADIGGSTAEVLKNASERELSDYFKDIAEQAHDPNSVQLTIETFGEEIVNKAKELYPLERPKESSISIIQPGEIKQPEVITIKPKEGAVSEQITNEVDVRQQAGDGEALVTRDAQPEIITREEGQQRPPEEGSATGKEGQVSEPEMIGITHAEMDKVSRELGLPEYSKDPETFESWTREAKDRLAKDPDAVNKLINKLREGVDPDPVETQMMKMHFAALKDRYNNNPTPELRMELARTKDLYNISGRRLGKSLGARKGLVPQEDTLADFHMRDVEFNRNAPLTDEQVAQSTKEYNEIKAARDAFEAKLKVAEEENAKLKADKKLQQEAKAAKKDANKDYKEERKQILKDIGDKWRKSYKGDLGVSLVPYAKELAAIAPDVIKLVKNVVEEGITELPKVIKSVHTQIKDIIPSITERDVHDIIAGEHSKKQTRSQLATILFDLRKETRLMNELDQLLKGEVPTNEKKLRQRNQRIEDLRSQIKELKDEMGLNEKSMEERLSALKGRYKSQIRDVEGKIARGDYGPDEKPTPIKLDKEALELKDKLIKLKLDREARLAQQEYDNRTKFQKGKDLAADALDATRTIQTNPDLSFFGRQGIKYLVTHPIKGPKLFWESAKQALSQKRYDRWLNDIHSSEAWKLIEDSGLAVLDPHTLHASMREEQWRSQLIHKIPVAGQVAKASERAFTSAANMARVDWFMEGVNILRQQGKTFENSPEEYKGWASAVNNMTGRGGLGAFEGSVGQLAIPFWSPRLIASNVNLFLNPFYYTKMPKTARAMLVKNMAQYVVTGVGMLALAKTLGADVEADPRSSDFGKIKVGNTRYDVWGGAAQYIRAVAQIFKGQRKSNGGVQDLDAKDRTIVGANLVRSKLSPFIGFGVDAILGKNIVGEDVDWKDAWKLMVPMLYNDIKEAYRDGGADQAAVSGLLSFLGIGAQTYAQRLNMNAGKGKLSKRAKHTQKSKN